MKVFDPDRKRELLDGDTGYEWRLARSFDEVYKLKALSNVAHADVADAMKCVLVGYDEPAARFARRAREWLTIAVQEDEPHNRYSPDYIRAQRHFNLAQCTWLLEGARDAENLRLFLEHERRYHSATSELDKVGVSLAMVEYLDAGDDRPTLDLLLRAGIGPPSSFGAIRTEGQMAYVLCRKRLGEAYEDANVDGALAAFLKREVNGWLIDGHYTRAAIWMKVAHWREGGPLSPQETVRKAYDYLPGVARPAPVSR